jgi:hypothetical protein
MDAPSFENLRRFFERIKNVGFFERLFSWQRIVSQGYDAYGEYQRLQSLVLEKDQIIAGELAKNRDLAKDAEYQRDQVTRLQQESSKLEKDLSISQSRYDQLNSQFNEAQKALVEFKQKDDLRIHEHDNRINALNTSIKQLEDDRLRVQDARDAEIRLKFAEMEQTWRKHEENVEQALRSICKRHTIEYCDKEKFPIAGKKPDNAVIIADQYVIFDAKSPKNSDELGNFPIYIKNQAEAAKKYANEENVKKDIFLVVPANTLESLEEFHFDMADYQVYVVTYECLEPVVLALRKIEDYQFVDQLSPEDRENICHVIGRFAHATKRRIQIDTYFSNEFIRLLQSCSSLPPEILEKVLNHEKAEKMNPPMEKRKKLIPMKELEHDVKVVSKEAEAREIDVTAVTKERIENIPLDKLLE